MPVILALVIRLIYHLVQVPDFWGDAYHSFYISQLTLANDWVYSDYKGREVVWLPLYRYLVAFLLWVFDGQSLTVPQLFNGLTGALSCGLVAVLVARESDKKLGTMAGLLLALSPWHIAYSHMNMPEMLGAFLLLGCVLSVQLKNWVLLLVLGFTGVLTKNEVTLFMAVIGLGLLWWREWKMAAALAAGALLGLAIWAHWNYQQTGNMVWWITKRSLGSSWDKFFYSEAGRSEGAWYVPLVSILQVSPLILILFLWPRRLIRAIKEYPGNLLLLMSVLVVFNWIFITLMNLRYFPYPDARYFIITLPILTGALVLWLRPLHLGHLGKKIIWVALLICCFQTPSFYFLHYPLNPAIKMGQYIQAEGLGNANYWNDFPTVSYYGQMVPEYSFSSRMLAPKELRYQANFNQEVIGRLLKHRIRYIIQQEVPYSYVTSVWPEMREGKAFQWEGFRFIPLYQYQFTAEEPGWKD